MNDRELLELAAKAAGIGGGWGEVHKLPQGEVDCTDIWMLDSEDAFFWNPLTDDGDALRLAVKLHIRIWGPGHAETPEGRPCVEGESADEYANTRRAIVRAAAEIGRSMP